MTVRSTMNAEKHHNIVLYSIIFFMIICPTELIFKSEQYYYIVCFILLAGAKLKNGFELKRDYSWAILLYAIYSAFTLFWSNLPGATGMLLVKTVATAVLFLQIQNEYGPDAKEIIKNTIVIQYIFVLLICLRYQYTAWDGRLWIVNGSLKVDGNSISSWLILPCCLFIERTMDKKQTMVRKTGYILLLVSLFYLAYWTGSRAGIIAVAIAAGLSLIYAYRDSLRKNTGLSAVILLISAAIVFIGIRMIPGSVIARFNYVNSAELGGRTQIWRIMFNDLIQNPAALIFGFGEGTTISNTGTIAHSLYIEALYNQGIIGITLILYFMVRAFINAARQNPYFAIAMIGISVMSASLSEFASRPVMIAFFLCAMNTGRNEGEEMTEITEYEQTTCFGDHAGIQ